MALFSTDLLIKLFCHSCFVVPQYGAVFDRFTGVDIPLFVAACARLANSINITPSLPTSTISSTSTAIDINATQLQSNGLSDSEFQIYLSKLVCHAPVMLFIKVCYIMHMTSLVAKIVYLLQ